MGFFIALIWCLLASMFFYNFRDIIEDLSEFRQFLLVLILLLGAPFFFIVEILEFLLDLILPEGWDDN